MTALFRSELLKLRTTRTALTLAVGLLAITLVGVVGVLVLSDGLGASAQENVIGAAAFSILFSILFGILVMTGEFRHGTATPTFLASPKRERVVVAKALAAVVGGFMLALSALLVAYAVAVTWLLAAGEDVLLFEREPLRDGLALLAAAAIWGALGVGVGAVVRSQVGAIVGALVWFLILEGLLGVLWSDAAPYLPGAAIGAVFDASDELSSGAGAALSIGYALAFCAAGTVLTARRDLT